MAISCTVDLPQGLTIQGAYIKIGQLIVSKDQGSVSAEVFASAQARIDGKPALHRVSLGFSPDLGDGAAPIFGQGYVALKTLPDFAGATDC